MFQRAMRSNVSKSGSPLPRGRTESVARAAFSTPRRLLIRVHVPVGAWRRAPAGDRAVGAAPHLRALWLVLVPGARIEDADLLIQNLIKLGEELDHLLIGIAMIDRYVVAGAVAQRPPDDRDAVLRKHVAAVLQVREVAQLEREMMHVRILAPDEIHHVVVRVAAHEHEDVLDPVGNAKAEDA